MYMVVQNNPARPLRLLGSSRAVPKARSKQEEVAFGHYAAQRWNRLPDGLRSAPTNANCSRLFHANDIFSSFRF